jgi:hypothetical protein
MFDLLELTKINIGTIYYETHFIVPYLYKLNELGVQIFISNPGFANNYGECEDLLDCKDCVRFQKPWLDANMTNEQFAEILKIKYVQIIYDRPTKICMINNVQNSNHMCRQLTFLTVNDSYKNDYLDKGQNPFWIDIINAIEQLPYNVKWTDFCE